MVSIEGYLDAVLSDFKDYLDTEPTLCKLKKLHFDLDDWPDYSDINIQQLYLLRYGFAYSFEYKWLYKELFDRKVYRNQIKVLSIGCGNSIDYWSLVQALNAKLFVNCIVTYDGLDLIDWEYRVQSREKDNVNIELIDVADWLTGLDSLDYDVYMFPKSISEISEKSFNRMCDVLAEKDIEKEDFSCLISLRAEGSNRHNDMKRAKRITDAILSNGFNTNDNIGQFTSFIEPKKGIKSFDSSFDYPDEAKETIARLNELCKRYQKSGSNCLAECQKRLTRSATLTVGNINYKVLSFERK